LCDLTPRFCTRQTNVEQLVLIKLAEYPPSLAAPKPESDQRPSVSQTDLPAFRPPLATFYKPNRSTGSTARIGLNLEHFSSPRRGTRRAAA
jgi:hypothetical protein